MADAEDLKSSGDFSSCGFDSHPGHQFLLSIQPTTQCHREVFCPLWFCRLLDCAQFCAHWSSACVLLFPFSLWVSFTCQSCTSRNAQSRLNRTSLSFRVFSQALNSSTVSVVA